MDEILMRRQNPHSTEAEQAVIGSMLCNTDCIPQVISSIKSHDFYMEQNRTIFSTIYSMANNAQIIDVLTVKSALMKTGEFEETTLSNYLVQILDCTPSATHVGEYISIVKDMTLLRNIGQVSSEVLDMVQSGTERGEDLIEVAEQRIHAIRTGNVQGGLQPITSVLSNVYDHLLELAASNGTLAGMSTGLGDLDKAISGLSNSDLILLAARPGMGKTSMALNMLLHAGKASGKSVAFFSLEMSQEQLAMRLIATESFVDNKKLATGQLSDKDWENVAAACISLSQTKILINDNSQITVAEIKAQCRRISDLGLVIIDYLQLMQSAGGRSSSGGENRQQVVSEISRTLKIMAKELNVPVVCLSQLSRASEKRENKRPMLSDLRESGAIEQDADIVMFLFREDYYDKDSENHNIAECIISKNRHGETSTVELQWIPEFTAFRGIDRTH